ncbi:MAG: glycosyltransferase family 2 protein [Burkholderiales bacterium]|nr:glycosyltransferase family 2 protein [Burkholderiales bacterium]
MFSNPEWQVPTHEEKEFSSRRNPYAIVIPVINEGERIQAQLREMASLGIMSGFDVVIADGGSTDGSLDDDFLHEMDITALLTKTGAGHLSSQLRMAYAWCLDKGYDGIITIDGNGKDSVASIPQFGKALDDGIDYVQASRFIKGGKAINTPLIRTMAIRLLHAPLTSLSARHWLTDTTQGFRAYSKRYLLDDRVKPFRSCFMDYELLAYLAVRATQLGYTATEVPTTRSYPGTGKIPTKISPVRGSAGLLKVLFKACLGGYNP